MNCPPNWKCQWKKTKTFIHGRPNAHLLNIFLQARIDSGSHKGALSAALPTDWLCWYELCCQFKTKLCSLSVSLSLSLVSRSLPCTLPPRADSTRLLIAKLWPLAQAAGHKVSCCITFYFFLFQRLVCVPIGRGSRDPEVDKTASCLVRPSLSFSWAC